MATKALPGLRVLLLEDDLLDAELIERALKESYPSCEVLRAEGRPAFTRGLEVFRPDVVLSDHAVSDFNALDALHLVQSRAPESPLLLVSGAYDALIGRCLKEGAVAFVSKSDLTLLAESVREALVVRSPLRRLTERQLQVLHLMASGNSTREIARRLRLSVKTVESHRAQVMKRLGMKDLVSVVRFAIKVGIVSPQ